MRFRPSTKAVVMLLLVSIFPAAFIGCSTANPAATSVHSAATGLAASSVPTVSTSIPYNDRAQMRVATIQGPSGIGMVQLMEQNEKQSSRNRYSFTVEPSAQNIASMVISGQVDVACVPTNLAATLYNKMSGGARLIALNTLGVLYIVENGNTVSRIEDLRGKTLHVSGQGSIPQYAIEYILAAYSLSGEVNVVYYADHDELAALAAAGKTVLSMLPEPKVTAALSQNASLRIAVDITRAWADAAKKNGDTGSVLTMGGVVVRTDYLQAHPEAVKAFLAEYKISVDFISANIAAGSVLVEKFGIMPKAAVAAKAIPNCNIVFIQGAEMASSIRKLYDVLFASNPQSIGGLVPKDDFYYIGIR
jgi:NitT/TauT family transport system substrate-binding protein